MYIFIKSLKDVMRTIVPEKQKEVAELRKQYADKVIGQYTVDQVCAHFLVEIFFGKYIV